MRLFSYPWQYCDAAQCFAVLSGIPYSLFFDSARPQHRLSQYSYLCWHPEETIECKDGIVRIIDKKSEQILDTDPFGAVQERLRHYQNFLEPSDSPYPFTGGAAGFFGYDLGRCYETLPNVATAHPTMPDMAIGLYTQVLAFDHKNKKAQLFIYSDDERDALVKKHWIETHVTKATSDAYLEEDLIWKETRSEKAYLKDIQIVIDYIHAGDIFQTNLSRKLESELPASFEPYTHYMRLRDINAAPFSSYMNFGNFQLSSTSPERFLSVQNGYVETRPIKGTRPANQDPQELLESPKDRAENAMIVDLLRNDLSKVCKDNSIHVLELCGLETFEGVHHLVSIIDGTLKEDCDALDLLKACFPGGSITGAPKIRAMEIIEELESSRRGPYCGSMGYIGFNGNMDSNIAIRTLVYEGSSVTLQTGGGITANSDAEEELQETKHKAQKIIESFKPGKKPKQKVL